MNRDCAYCMVLIFTLIGVGLSVSAQIWCEFIKFTLPVSGKDISLGLWRYSSFAFVVGQGIWKVETCASYNSWFEPNATWKAARAFGILAPILAVAAPFLLGLTHQGKLAGVFLAFVTLCQGLTFLMFTDEVCDPRFNPVFSSPVFSSQYADLIGMDKCVMGGSATASIIATVCYFLTAVASCAYSKGENDDEEQDVGASGGKDANDEEEQDDGEGEKE